MVRRILRRFGNELEVEDALQEVFLRVFTRLPAVRDPHALQAFVITITVRVAGRHARRARARQWLALSAADTATDARATDDVTAQHALKRLSDVLSRVRECDRTAFVLRYIEGRQVREIADLAQLSRATIKRRLIRASARVSYLASRDLFLAEYLNCYRPPPGPEPL
jgi:RNA polymerase sigma-70 factor, ECF subfamily